MVYLAALLEWRGEQRVFRHQQCLLMQPEAVPCPSQVLGPGIEQGELPSSMDKQCTKLPAVLLLALYRNIQSADESPPGSWASLAPQLF